MAAGDTTILITIFVGILEEAQQIEISQQQIPRSSKEEEEEPTRTHLVYRWNYYFSRSLGGRRGIPVINHIFIRNIL